MKMQHFEKKMKQIVTFASIFVIYDQIMSGLVRLSNHVLGYIQIPLKEILDISFKTLQCIICNSSFTCLQKPKNFVKIYM